MKQEATNTFGEGIIMDLNPLTTPNNVLTSALNATMITYNGNEFVLQNDMGNGRVETAYLPSGYVPVGIKEYGGIIYVASYNPLTNKGQIGSFPSPERNISSNEISNATEPILESGSFGDLTAPGSQFTVKLKLFPDDVIIRSGDKFSILLKSQSDLNTLQKFVSNCVNITDGKVTSPKNKLLTLSVAVLDSNNNFRDITDKLRRFDEDNKEIEFAITELPIIKLNSGFFTQTFDGTPSDVDTYRQQRATNTYNNKVFGELFLIATLNTITSVDVSVEGYINKEDSDVIIDGLPPIETGTTLVFTLNYKYNCPDGVYDSQYPERYLSASDDFKNTYHCYHGVESEFAPSQVINGTLLKTTGVDNSNYKIPFIVDKGDLNTYPLFDSDNGYYSKNQSAYLKLDTFEGLLNYSITPCMTYAPLTGLTTNGTINVAKLGTGSIEINNWRYYCNPTSMTLTWGLESYPLTGTWIDNVTIEFYDILNDINTPVKTLIPSRKRSYNGVFTETIPFDNSISRGSLYLARVTCAIGKSSTTDLETRLLGYRWMLTTNLYNSMYFGTNADSSISDYNNFTEEQLADYNTVALELTVSNESSKSLGDTTTHGSTWGTETSTATVLDKRKAANVLIKDSIESFSELQNKNNYPFTLNQDKLTTTYKLMDGSKMKLGNITFYGQRGAFNDIVIDEVTEINPSPSIDSTNYNEHQYTISQNENVISVHTRMLSQLVGNAVIREVSIAHPFVPFITEENFGNIFGYNYLDGDNKSLGAYAKTSFSLTAAARGRSGHGDEHWMRLYGIGRVNHGDLSSEWKIREEHQHGDSHRHFYASNYWDSYSQSIKDTLGNVVCVAFQGATMYSGADGWDWNDYFNRVSLSGQWYRGRYQMLLWYTGSRFVFVRMYFSYDDSNCTEMPQVVYNTFKDFYIMSDDSGMVRLKVLSPDNYTYNDDYKTTIIYSIQTTKTGTDETLVYKEESYNSLMSNNVRNLLNSDTLVTDADMVSNQLIRLATFHMPSESNKINEFTIEVSTIGMQSDYISNNSLITSGIDTALVANDIVYERDSNNQALLSSSIYYVDSNGVTEASKSSMASYVKNLKVGKVGGRTTLIAKGTTRGASDYQIDENKSGDSRTTVHFEGLPVIDIPLKVPTGATTNYLY